METGDECCRIIAVRKELIETGGLVEVVVIMLCGRCVARCNKIIYFTIVPSTSSSVVGRSCPSPVRSPGRRNNKVNPWEPYKIIELVR